MVGKTLLKPARLGATILHGPNIDNFSDIYELLDKLKITHKVNGVKLI